MIDKIKIQGFIRKGSYTLPFLIFLFGINTELSCQQIINGSFEDATYNFPNIKAYIEFFPDSFPLNLPNVYKRYGDPRNVASDTNSNIIIRNTNKWFSFLNGHPINDTNIYAPSYYSDSCSCTPGHTREWKSNLSLKLSTPLSQGKSYHLRYLIAIDTLVARDYGYFINKIGLSKNHQTFGDSIGETPIPQFNLNWQTVDLYFTAPNDGTFITLEISKLLNMQTYFIRDNGVSTWTTRAESIFLDNFELVCSTDIGKDTLVCQGKSTIIKSNKPLAKYLWSTYDTTENITIDSSGKYWVTVNENGCISSDTIYIEMKNIPKEFLGKDTIICNRTSYVLDPNIKGNYLWSDGSKFNYLNINKSANYSVEISDGNCKYFDTVLIEFEPKQILNISKNNFLCKDSLFVTYTNISNLKWLDADKKLIYEGNNFIFLPIYENTFFYVTSGIKCSYIDSINIRVKECIPPNLNEFIPNAFSPNSDLINEQYNPRINDWIRTSMIVYNRWGQIVFNSESPSEGWDGTFLGTDCQQEVYLIQLKFKSEFGAPAIFWSGTIHLIR